MSSYFTRKPRLEQTMNSLLSPWSRYIHRSQRTRKSKVSAKDRQKSRRRLDLERLEDRTVPSTNPFVQSFNLAVPSGPITNANSVSYTVTFSGPVSGVDSTDFQVVSSGTVTSGAIQVTLISSSSYTVTVNSITGDGTLRLDLVNDGTIHDQAGNQLTNFGGPASFQNEQRIASGWNPGSLSVGDLNGDGKPDILEIGLDSSLTVHLGNGDGTFQDLRTYASGISPHQQVTADLNGDGINDLVIGDRLNKSVSVFLGKSDGTYQAMQTFSPIDGGGPNSVAVADVNQDGKLDIVANTGGGYTNVLLGNGDGTFQLPLEDQVPGLMVFSHSQALADVNGDNKLDLVVASPTDNSVSLLMGNGDGSFQQPQTLVVGANPDSVAVADVNGDGKPDIVVANYGLQFGFHFGSAAQPPYYSSVGVLLGNGDGSFQSMRTFTTLDHPTSVRVADFNHDGNLDIIASYGGGGTQSVLLGNGDGTFQSQQIVPATDPGLADVNGDGILDQVYAYTNFVAPFSGGAVGVRLGNGDGTFQSEQTFAVGYVPLSLAVADINGDQLPDLVVGIGPQLIGNNYQSTLSVLLNSHLLSGPFRRTGPAYTIDHTAPTIVLPPDQIFGATSAQGALVSYIVATATDADTITPTLTYSIPSGSQFPLGTTVVTVTATDDKGTQSTGTFKVTVQDLTPPQLTPLVDQVFKAPTAQGTVVHYVGATATDNVTANPTITYSNAQDSFFSVGTHVITVTATDAAGNQATGTFNLIVQYTPPTASIGNLPSGNTQSENTVAVLSASAVHPLSPNSTDVFSFNWTASQNGSIFATVSGPNFTFLPPDNGPVVVSLTATDSDGATSSPATATVTWVNIAPLVSIGVGGFFNSSAYVSNPLTFQANVSDSPADVQQGFAYSWSVTQGGAPYTLPAGTITNSSVLNFTPPVAGDYVATVTVTDRDGAATTASQDVNVTVIDATSFQNFLNGQADSPYPGIVYPVAATLQTDPTQVGNVINVLNALVAPTGFDDTYSLPFVAPVVVTLNLTSGTYPDLNFNLQPGVTVVVNGVPVTGSTVVKGNSPALTVLAGNVIVNNVTFTTATDSPTVLVAGGSLAMRGDVVQESTGFADAAIAVTNGSLDLGTNASAGNNTININGSGSPVQSTGTGVVTAAGDTFQSNGTTVNPLSSLTLTSSVNPAFFGQSITLTATIAVGSTQKSSPTGTVTFYDLTRGVTLGSSKVSKGIAQWTGSTLAPGGHVVRAVYGGDANFISSSADLVENVSSFSGFLAPLSNNLAFNMNRVIPIKWQLGDSNGKIVTGLNAIMSLQVAPVLSGGALGTPFNPTASNGIGLRNDGKQYTFNWDTKNVAVGTYQIILTLADGTVQTKTLQIVTKGGYNGLLVDGTVAATTGVGGLLAGDIELYVDNSSGLLTSDELARIDDAVAAVDAVIGPYGVTINEVSDSASANVVLDTGSTSAVGGFADGVLGCTGDGEITLIQGWNWYAGSDATQIGAGQYDFETVVVHELGHALGLGHSATAGSVMYPTLDAGTANRGLATADLNIADSGTGADGLHAASSNPVSALETGFFARDEKPGFQGRNRVESDLFFAFAGTALDGLPAAAGSETRAERSSGVGDPRRAGIDAVFAHVNEQPNFAGQSQRPSDDPLAAAENLDDYVPADFSWQE
jgi:hypothetical protein